jgi:hypothetical protein
MRRSRLLTAAAGLGASVLVSIAALVLFDTLLLFLVVPFVPFLFRNQRGGTPLRVCPVCGFQTRSSEFDYCPRDGTELERDANRN